MQLMQMNYFLEKGLLEVDPAGQLVIRYDRYHDTVAALLREVLAVQHAGDKAASDRFIERYTTWSPGPARAAGGEDEGGDAVPFPDRALRRPAAR